MQLEPHQSEQISLVWIKFPVTFSQSITVMNTVRKVSKRLLCIAEIFLRVSWWSLIQILREGTRWWEKANMGWTYGQVCVEKFMWFQPQTSLEGVCPNAKNNRIYDLMKSSKKGKENAVYWFIFKHCINMFLCSGWTFCHEPPLTHLNHLILIRWGWTHCWPH